MSDLRAFMAQFDGGQFPGGCEECDAYQVVAPIDAEHPNVMMLNTFHDDDCPWLARLKAEQQR